MKRIIVYFLVIMALALLMGLLTKYTYATSFMSNTGITKIHMRVLPRKLENLNNSNEEIKTKKTLPIIISADSDSHDDFWGVLNKIFGSLFNE